MGFGFLWWLLIAVSIRCLMNARKRENQDLRAVSKSKMEPPGILVYLSQSSKSLFSRSKQLGCNWRPDLSPELDIVRWTIPTSSTSPLTRRSAGDCINSWETNLHATWTDGLGSIDVGRPDVSIRLKLHVSRLYHTRSLFTSSMDGTLLGVLKSDVADCSRPSRTEYRSARPKTTQALISLYRLLALGSW